MSFSERRISLVQLPAYEIESLLVGRRRLIITDAPEDLTVLRIHDDDRQQGVFVVAKSRKFGVVDGGRVIPLIDPPITCWSFPHTPDGIVQWTQARFIKCVTDIGVCA